MDKQQKDQWLRESLRDYKPQPEATGREAFLDAAVAAGKSTKNPSWLKSKRFLLPVLLFFSLTAAYFYRQKPLALIQQPAHIQGETNQAALLNDPFTPSQTTMGDAATVQNFSPDAAKIPENETRPVTKSSNQKQATGLINAPNTANSETIPAVGIHENGTSLAEKEHNINDSVRNHISSPTKSGAETGTASAEDINTTVVERVGEETGEEQVLESEPFSYRPAHNRGHEWFVYYRPEWVYNIIENNKLIHNIGIDYSKRFFNNRYSFRIGMGLSFSKGYYEYATQYNEYKGSFSKLDSVTFAWDQQQYNLVPTIFTSQAEAFDDDIQTAYAKVYKQHVYLLLPLMLGYDFAVHDRWRMGLRAGPRMAVLVNTKKLTFLPDIGRNKLIQINQITPDRIKTNWQIAAGINMAFRTRKLIVEIEPQGVYYFNSVYETSDLLKAPWSVSLRLAVGFAK